MKIEEIVIDGKRYRVCDNGVDAIVDGNCVTVFAGAVGIKITVNKETQGETCGSYYPMEP